jgi:hypothetical protein
MENLPDLKMHSDDPDPVRIVEIGPSWATSTFVRHFLESNATRLNLG